MPLFIILLFLYYLSPAMDIFYQEYKPTAALQSYIECFWYHVSEGHGIEESPVQHCLPLGVVEIIHYVNRDVCKLLVDGKWIDLPDAFMVGIWKDTAIWKVIGKAETFGIRIKPEGLLQLFKMPASAIYLDYTDLESVLGKNINAFSDSLYGAKDVRELIRISEQFLTNKLQQVNVERNYVVEATKLIRQSKGALTIEKLSESLYVSKRQLERSFKDHYGASPKVYQRIIRFRYAYNYIQRSKNQPTWADVAYQCGYADQAHMIRDFKEFTGHVPTLLTQKEESYYQLKGVLL
jgi:AraC-like DNA-binding protein